MDRSDMPSIPPDRQLSDARKKEYRQFVKRWEGIASELDVRLNNRPKPSSEIEALYALHYLAWLNKTIARGYRKHLQRRFAADLKTWTYTKRIKYLPEAHVPGREFAFTRACYITAAKWRYYCAAAMSYAGALKHPEVSPTERLLRLYDWEDQNARRDVYAFTWGFLQDLGKDHLVPRLVDAVIGNAPEQRAALAGDHFEGAVFEALHHTDFGAPNKVANATVEAARRQNLGDGYKPRTNGEEEAKPRTYVSTPFITDLGQDDAARIAADTEKRAIIRIEAQEAMAVVNQLSDHQRTAWLLHEVDGLTVPDIAEITGVPYETAKKRVQRAVAHIKKLQPPA
jgi:hypothetical protein